MTIAFDSSLRVSFRPLPELTPSSRPAHIGQIDLIAIAPARRSRGILSDIGIDNRFGALPQIVERQRQRQILAQFAADADLLAHLTRQQRCVRQAEIDVAILVDATPTHSKPLARTRDGIAVNRPIKTLAANGGLHPCSSRPQTGHPRNPMPASVRASVRAASRSVFDGKALTENRPGPHIASNSGQVSLAKR